MSSEPWMYDHYLPNAVAYTVDGHGMQKVHTGTPFWVEGNQTWSTAGGTEISLGLMRTPPESKICLIRPGKEEEIRQAQAAIAGRSSPPGRLRYETTAQRPEGVHTEEELAMFDAYDKQSLTKQV